MATFVLLCLALALASGRGADVEPSTVLPEPSTVLPEPSTVLPEQTTTAAVSSSATAQPHPASTWVPSIACSKTTTGETITVKLYSGLSDFSLLVVNPPQGCTADLGEFRNDIIIPENCFTKSSVEIALQHTSSKELLGGRNFRHFQFTCLDLGVNGQVKDLSIMSDPTKTSPTDQSANYRDGQFSLLVVTKASLSSNTALTGASSISWSQDDVYLVVQHSLAQGSSHRTLFPTECKVSSTSHPDKVTVYVGKTGLSCSTNSEVLGPWTVHSKRIASEDVTYAQMFPFAFQAGEQVLVSCSVHECPYVSAASALGGTCKTTGTKFASCGGSFYQTRFRRAVTGNDSTEDQEVTTRVISASFTVE